MEGGWRRSGNDRCVFLLLGPNIQHSERERESTSSAILDTLFTREANWELLFSQSNDDDDEEEKGTMMMWD